VYTDDLDIGVIGPIEIVNLSSGQRWLPVTGTLVDTTNTSNNWTPSLTVTARNSSGGLVATLNKTFLLPGADEEPILPARMFNAWIDLTPTQTVAKVRIQASLPIGSGIASQTRDIAVVNASPLAHLGRRCGASGPGQQRGADRPARAHPRARSALRLRPVHQAGGSTARCSIARTTCADNSDFLCWGQPVRAALGGTVGLRPGRQRSTTWSNAAPLGPNNEVIIQHANGYFTATRTCRRTRW
jgi:hypothetical protein